MTKIILTSMLYTILSGCASFKPIGTGQHFTALIDNPEPSKSSVVYVYRNDGWGYGGRAEMYLLLNIEPENGPKIPVAILQNKMYRPYLFEPKAVKLGSPAGTSVSLNLSPGDTKCVEIGWKFRGVDIVTTNEIPIKECLEALQGMELAMSLNDIRKRNNGAPFAQQGFKELIDTSAISAPQSK